MRSLMTEPIAAVVQTLDDTNGATLTEIARRSGKPVSTIQRAVDTLVDSDLVIRPNRPGQLRLAPNAPRRALRALADWRLAAGAQRPVDTSRDGARPGRHRAPATIRNPNIRRSWPAVIDSIVSGFDPAKVILFGSQARGDARPDSDVDLLVIFDREVHRREKQVAIRQVLSDMPFAKDVIVRTTGDLERPLPGSVVLSAVREGLVVYER
jgi:predicted nucleotidyltransferase